MFLNSSRLPHVLPPQLYGCAVQHETELAHLFAPAWLLVGNQCDAPKDGDFFTRELLGKPILIRNVNGVMHAYLNVCTHRHCMLTHEERGHAKKLTCQYHGWEYNPDGSSGKIPDAQSFRPIPGGPERLKRFPTEMRGPFIFVSLHENPPALDQQLGPLLAVCNEFPAERWRLTDAWKYDIEANWKIVVENTVESYHIPSVHPKTLIRYGLEEEIEHEIHPTATVMRAPLASPPLYRKLTDRLLDRIEPGCSHLYRLYHCFPNLFLVRVDAMLQVMVVTPTSAEKCRLDVSLFTLRAERETFTNKLITSAWGRFKRMVIKTILAEDGRLYPDLQRGMKASPFQGTISTREELVHAFQAYVSRECGLEEEPTQAAP